MNILVTGVTSFIGRALVNELLAEGYEVYGLVRPTSANQENLPSKLNIISYDMDEVESLEDMGLPAMYACVHLAWGGIGKDGRANADIQEVNRQQTLRLIKTAKKLGCERFLFAGSQAEYGVTLQRVDGGVSKSDEVGEDYDCSPVSEYGKAKLDMLDKANELCKELGMTYIHMRIYSAYGVGDHETSLVNCCVKAFARDEHISLTNCRQMWNYINVRDAAKAIADLLSCVMTFTEEDETEEHIVNVAGEDTRPLKDFVASIQGIVGKGSYDLKRVDKPAEGTPYLNPSTARLKMLTGFVPGISFEEGIREIEEMYSLRGEAL